MSTILFHQMSHASCLNVETYIKVGRDPWQRVRNLLVAIHFLFESLKETPYSSQNVSKLFERGD
jgi:hypothetical protein